MGKIFVLIGKSASGKDAVYQRMMQDEQLKLEPYVGYTTRPIRAGEQNGREYYFVSGQQLQQFEETGKLIEKRVYHTVHGDWTYFSVDSDAIDLTKHSYLYIGTLESFLPVRNYYGSDQVIPIFIQVDDGVRLQRALDRERQQLHPSYAEMCRRFLTDEQDFSEEKIRAAGITRRFDNMELGKCVEEIRTFIREQM